MRVCKNKLCIFRISAIAIGKPVTNINININIKIKIMGGITDTDGSF